MAHAVVEEQPAHMGLPINNGKLAMWLFLVTEIMFFTGLIGTYIILRNGQGANDGPTPHQVHLVEWIGALNTFVLICSSLTVVLAHHAIAGGKVKQAAGYVAITLALGAVFLGVKAYEYNAKIEHAILPGYVFEMKSIEGTDGPLYVKHVKGQLQAIVNDPKLTGIEKESERNEAVAECTALLTDLNSKVIP